MFTRLSNKKEEEKEKEANVHHLGGGVIVKTLQAALRICEVSRLPWPPWQNLETLATLQSPPECEGHQPRKQPSPPQNAIGGWLLARPLSSSLTTHWLAQSSRPVRHTLLPAHIGRKSNRSFLPMACTNAFYS